MLFGRKEADTTPDFQPLIVPLRDVINGEYSLLHPDQVTLFQTIASTRYATIKKEGERVTLKGYDVER